MRVVQPEVREDGHVYIKETQPHNNPHFVVEAHGHLVGLITHGKWTCPVSVKESILTKDQMDEVMIRVAMVLSSLEEQEQ